MSEGGERNTSEAAQALERECSGLRSRLDGYLQTYGQNPESSLGLALSRVDVALYENLVSLATEGLKCVRRYRSHFPRLSLYADGMFWYHLFEVINAAGRRIWQDKDEVHIPRSIVTALGVVLVEMSWFSTATGGDIENRNMEALGSTFLAFGDAGLEADLRRKARAMRAKRVTQFLDDTMAMVRQLGRG